MSHHMVNFLPVSLFANLNSVAGYRLSLGLSLILPAVVQLLKIFSHRLERSKARKRPRLYHVTCSFLIVLQQTASMLLMLLVMSLNVWVVVCVVLSSVVGYFLTSWVLLTPHAAPSDVREGTPHEVMPMMNNEKEITT